MDYRFMGKTGLRVSELCLGALTFGRESSEEVSRAILDRFVDAGGNFIDTADTYSAGLSEEVLGRWLAGKGRDDLVIATKARYPMGQGPNEVGLSRKHILASVEASLRRLRTDYIEPVPGPLLGPCHAPRGDPEHAPHPRARRQSALHRRQQLQRMAAPESDRP